MTDYNPTINDEDGRFASTVSKDQQYAYATPEDKEFPEKPKGGSGKLVILVFLIIFLLAAVGGVVFILQEDTKEGNEPKPLNPDDKQPVDPVDPTDPTKPDDGTDTEPIVIDDDPKEPYHEFQLIFSREPTGVYHADDQSTMNWRKFRPISVAKLIDGGIWKIATDPNGHNLPIVTDDSIQYGYAYHGQASNDTWVGLGRRILQNEGIIEAIWADNQVEGWGRLIWKDGQYFGYMKNNKPYGYGISIDKNGKEYPGYWNKFSSSSKPIPSIPDEYQKPFDYKDYLKIEKKE